MNDYIHNKQPKNPKLCKLIRKCITINRKEIGLELEDVAHELGMSKGTLENKLKPSMATNDLSITEFIHFLELTGDYSALKFIASEFDFTLVKNEDIKPTCREINTLVDNLSIESSDVFRVAKEALKDNKIDSIEREKLCKELDEVVTAALTLKKKIRV